MPEREPYRMDLPLKTDALPAGLPRRRPLGLLDRGAVPDTDVVADAREYNGEAGNPRLCCRICARPVTAPNTAIVMAGRHRHRCTNPLGHTFEIGCFAHATGCQCPAPATRDHTWFAGYAWRIALCGGCGSHLGWRYEGEATGFYGLILEQLVECDDHRPH